MQLQCSALRGDQRLPKRYAYDYENISPPLSWQHPPENTRSYALIVEDPDAPSGLFTHWLVYNLPGEAYHLPEAIAANAQLENGAMQGQNDFGDLGWGGPSPPSGTHRYMFQLYALERPLDLKPGVTKSELLTHMQGHILDRADLTSLYGKSED